MLPWRRRLLVLFITSSFVMIRVAFENQLTQREEVLQIIPKREQLELWDQGCTQECTGNFPFHWQRVQWLKCQSKRKPENKKATWLITKNQKAVLVSFFSFTCTRNLYRELSSPFVGIRYFTLDEKLRSFSVGFQWVFPAPILLWKREKCFPFLKFFTFYFIIELGKVRSKNIQKNDKSFQKNLHLQIFSARPFPIFQLLNSLLIRCVWLNVWFFILQI